VVRWDIESLKVVPVRLDLRAVSDLVAHRDEQILDLSREHGDGVQRTASAALDSHV